MRSVFAMTAILIFCSSDARAASCGDHHAACVGYGISAAECAQAFESCKRTGVFVGPKTKRGYPASSRN
jgi:hypothetical protein